MKEEEKNMGELLVRWRGTAGCGRESAFADWLDARGGSKRSTEGGKARQRLTIILVEGNLPARGGN